MDYILRFIVGGLAVVLVTYIVNRSNSDIVGVLAFMPIVSLVSYYFIGKTEGNEVLRSVVMYTFLGMPALIAYLVSLQWLLQKFTHTKAIFLATLIWLIVVYLSVKINRLLS